MPSRDTVGAIYSLWDNQDGDQTQNLWHPVWTLDHKATDLVEVATLGPKLRSDAGQREGWHWQGWKHSRSKGYWRNLKRLLKGFTCLNGHHLFWLFLLHQKVARVVSSNSSSIARQCNGRSRSSHYIRPPWNPAGSVGLGCVEEEPGKPAKVCSQRLTA